MTPLVTNSHIYIYIDIDRDRDREGEIFAGVILRETTAHGTPPLSPQDLLHLGSLPLHVYPCCAAEVGSRSQGVDSGQGLKLPSAQKR